MYKEIGTILRYLNENDSKIDLKSKSILLTGFKNTSQGYSIAKSILNSVIFDLKNDIENTDIIVINSALDFCLNH